MLKRIIAPIAISGALLTGVASIGVAGVADAATPTVTVPVQSSNHVLGRWLRAHRLAIRRDVVTISAKTIGVSPQALVTELRSGVSIAGVASQDGVSPQSVATALVTAADTAVNQAVANHRLSATQANTIEAALPGYVNTLLSHTFK